ncbi:unnamed protein product [Oppiella nova]|uniref:Uncharacterized protein n=1 Tax=Oppiella nova TaxID=334625 RepID=A0A7R9LFP4_9ACAR|nr:unnamed protein product [Oppiella nova]CAG2163194.1 unnamed protein product [Oppiella nova]
MDDKILKSPLPPIPYPEISVAKYILDRLKQFSGQKTVLLDCPSGRKHSAQQVYDHILNIAAAFVDLGLNKGDVVLFISPNSDYYAIGLLAVMAAGGVFSACSELSSYREVYNAIEDTTAKYVVCTPDNLEDIKNIAECLPQIRKIILMSNEWTSQTDPKVVNYFQLYDYEASECSYDLPKRVDCHQDMAALLLSSGSTGRPKPIIRLHRNVINLTHQFQHQEIWGLTERSVHSCQNTFCHSGGLTFLLHSIASGAIAAIMPAFEGNKFINYVEKYKITSAFLVPSYVIFLANVDVSNRDVSSFEDIICAGSPLPEGIADKVFANMGLKYFRQGYGMTEVGFCTQVFRSKNLEHKASVGWCVPDSQVKVVDPNTSELLGPNQVGEVWIKSHQMTPGYLNLPDKNAESFDGQGFIRSGDAGYYDSQRLLYIMDRYKQILKVEGIIVLPSELEYLLLSHEDVSEAAVIGVKHSYYVEVPKAFVVLKPQRKVSEEKLIQYIDGLVNDVKKLRGGLTILQELPKTPLGKINKTLLQ